jgi:transketolase
MSRHDGKNEEIIASLQHKAYLLRYWSLRATTAARSGHPTSCLSAADIVATLFFYVMKVQHDHFILSKGHAAPLLYAAWHELGMINEHELLSLRTFNSVLEGHPTARFPLGEAATGSLGQGLSIGIGYAFGERFKQTNNRVYVLLGDGECAEGSVWEAAELAAWYKMRSVIATIDLNRLGQSGPTMDSWEVDRVACKWRAFGWHTIIINGHAIPELLDAYQEAETISEKPTMVIACTKKGFGVDICENQEEFHGRVFSPDELPKALKNLAERFKEQE